MSREAEIYRAALVRIADAESGHWGWVAREALDAAQDREARAKRCPVAYGRDCDDPKCATGCAEGVM